MSTGRVTLKRDEIRGVLSRADELARTDVDALKERHGRWVSIIERLRIPECPVTYLPVLAVLLTARALRPRQDLDVLVIKRGTGPKGYAAASIGRVVIPFAVEQGIDLRSRCSSVMNNQPFTFEDRIIPGMSSPSKATHYESFFRAACEVNDLDSISALEVLAMLFDVCRSSVPEGVEHVAVEGGQVALLHIIDRTAEFVRNCSENGRVGQAFGAAVLDLVYGSNRVVLGNTPDPDASVPGDVQVVNDDGTWLWVEVKQKSVTTGAVKTFIEKVRALGGERILYCALGNERYPHNIDRTVVERLADATAMQITVTISPADLLSEAIHFAPGSFSGVASTLINSMLQRLDEAGCAPETLRRFRESVGLP